MVSPYAPIDAKHPARGPAGPPLAVLIEPSGLVGERVSETLRPYGLQICADADPGHVPDAAALVVVEADRGARAISLIRRIHAQRPDLPIAAVLSWWSDGELEIAGITRYVLHVPLRDDQLAGFRDLVASLVR